MQRNEQKFPNIKETTCLMKLSPFLQVLANGNLILPPFRAEDYNQEVHAQTYRCLAANTFGKIQSRDVHVRAGTAEHIF